jgi:hypothetical protein
MVTKRRLAVIRPKGKRQNRLISKEKSRKKMNEGENCRMSKCRID